MIVSINIDSISSFIGTIISLTFAIYYMTSYMIVKKEKLHLIISIFMFSLVFYLSGYAFYSSGSNPDFVLFWTRICYSGGALIIFTGYLLSSEITQRRSTPLNYLIPGIVILLLISIYFPSDIFFTENLNPAKTHSTVIKGPLFPIILMIIFLTDFLLILRFIKDLMKDKENLYLIMPILFAILFWFIEAMFDGIFGAILSITNKKQSLGPIVMIFSLALYSGRYSEKKNKELIRVKEENRQINQSLIYDKLSNLYSREYFIQILKQRIALNERENVSDCLMFIDVDQFKTVNDELGHDSGDKVINYVGEVLRLHSRRTDICARYGGDEFLVLLENCQKNESMKIAEIIRSNFSTGLPSILKNWGGCQGVTLSIGVVDYLQWPGTADELIRNADQAMYEAKRQGKNTSVLYSSTMIK
jgi:diguanylate cyclase (GGDEF)-like protein